MNVDQIQERLAAIIVAMMAKGMETPQADFSIKGNGDFSVWLTAGRYGQPEYFTKYPNGATPEEALDRAGSLIATMPDPATAKLHNHMKRVADCIDKGREDGIDDAYIAPLVVVKAAMTENLLTKQVTA